MYFFIDLDRKLMMNPLKPHLPFILESQSAGEAHEAASDFEVRYGKRIYPKVIKRKTK